MDQARLVLGTAQLGFPYGIANKTGQPDISAATDIVREAWENGITVFDTAQGYGDSELVLGQVLKKLGVSQRAAVISKFDPQIDHLDYRSMSDALGKSLLRLGVESLHGIMLHRQEMLSIWHQGLKDTLTHFISSGTVQSIGISVYSPGKATEALNTEGINMIQIPTNILDRRFENAGVFELADKMKKRVYIRSVFLQGLLLMDIDAIPEKMAAAKTEIEKLEILSKEFKLTKQEIALGYVKTLTNTFVVFGAETLKQVKDNLKAWEYNFPDSLVKRIRAEFKSIDETILDPTLW
jgi:aryl-alcohol dehydrogenase-like predicted oxidoreductase